MLLCRNWVSSQDRHIIRSKNLHWSKITMDEHFWITSMIYRNRVDHKNNLRRVTESATSPRKLENKEKKVIQKVEQKETKTELSWPEFLEIISLSC